MREDEVIIKRKQYSKTDANNRNFGRFPFSYIYSTASRLSWAFTHCCHKPERLKHLLIWADGRWATKAPSWLNRRTGAFCDVTPRECKHPHVFTRERQLGFRGAMAEGPVHSPLVCLRTTPATPGTLTDLGLIRDHASPRKGEYKTFPLTFCGSHC